MKVKCINDSTLSTDGSTIKSAAIKKGLEYIVYGIVNYPSTTMYLIYEKDNDYYDFEESAKFEIVNDFYPENWKQMVNNPTNDLKFGFTEKEQPESIIGYEELANEIHRLGLIDRNKEDSEILERNKIIIDLQEFQHDMSDIETIIEYLTKIGGKFDKDYLYLDDLINREDKIVAINHEINYLLTLIGN